MCFPFPVLQDAAGVAKAMARAAVKVKCGGTVRRRHAQLALILPLFYSIISAEFMWKGFLSSCLPAAWGR